MATNRPTLSPPAPAAMPSKKKKSKGRGKAAKKADEQRSLDTQMERLKIDKEEDSQTNADEDALLEEAIKLAAAEKEEMDAESAEKEEQVCQHGSAVETKELVFFINVFTKNFSSEVSRRGDGNLAVCTEVAINAVEEKYPNVWNNPSKLKLVVTDYLCNGTHLVLQGEFGRARIFATMAAYLEAVAASKSGEEVNIETDTAKILEIFNCDKHTLVRYLRKRIPCSCLDEVYKEVKCITRTGVCHNCSSTVERSKMLTCARCGHANYCSRTCQKSDWQRHKKNCAASGLDVPLYSNAT